MSRNTTIYALAIALGLAASLAAPALAADTARASAKLRIYSGPGTGYSVIGSLAKNAEVELAFCTRSTSWCQIRDEDGERGGWVRGSYLVGMAAIMKATPFHFLAEDGIIKPGMP
jgi:uncharacterized protein YraI